MSLKGENITIVQNNIKFKGENITIVHKDHKKGFVLEYTHYNKILCVIQILLTLDHFRDKT